MAANHLRTPQHLPSPSHRQRRRIGIKLKEVINESRRRVTHEQIDATHPFETGDILHRDLLFGPPIHAATAHGAVDDRISSAQESNPPPVQLKHRTPRNEYEVGCYLGRP